MFCCLCALPPCRNVRGTTGRSDCGAPDNGPQRRNPSINNKHHTAVSYNQHNQSDYPPVALSSPPVHRYYLPEEKPCYRCLPGELGARRLVVWERVLRARFSHFCAICPIMNHTPSGVRMCLPFAILLCLSPSLTHGSRLKVHSSATICASDVTRGSARPIQRTLQIIRVRLTSSSRSTGRKG